MGYEVYKNKVSALTILRIVSKGPKTANEVAKELGIHQMTAQRKLIELVSTHPNEIGYKQIGRAHLFWKKTKKWI